MSYICLPILFAMKDGVSFYMCFICFNSYYVLTSDSKWRAILPVLMKKFLSRTFEFPLEVDRRLFIISSIDEATVSSLTRSSSISGSLLWFCYLWHYALLGFILITHEFFAVTMGSSFSLPTSIVASTLPIQGSRVGLWVVVNLSKDSSTLMD